MSKSHELYVESVRRHDKKQQQKIASLQRQLAEAKKEIERLTKLAYNEARQAFKGNIEAVNKLGLDAMQIQPILMAVQAGDISTGKARELIRCWILGTFAVEMLPRDTFGSLMEEDGE